MAHISSNAESPVRDYGYISQLTNCILDSGETCHMTPDISNFIPGLLAEADKYIQVSDGDFVIAKQTGEYQIKINDNNRKIFIATLYNILFALDLCN